MLATATVATWRDGRSECEKIGGEKAPALLMATAKTAAEVEVDNFIFLIMVMSISSSNRSVNTLNKEIA